MPATPPQDDRPPDVFYCPRCNQKHRGDLSTARTGAAVRVRCVGCGVHLLVQWKDGKSVVALADAAHAKATASAPPRATEATRTAEVVPAAETRAGAAPAKTPAGGGAPDNDPSGGDERESGREGTKRLESPARAGRRRDRLRDGAERREDPAAKPPPPRDPKASSRDSKDAKPAHDGKERAEKSEKARDEGLAEPEIHAEFPPGTTIGRYTIEAAIGQGGTGTVYRAFDATTNRYVALKVLGINQSDAMRQRFLREIEVEANLRHPNLMQVFDRGEHEGRPYFTMELLYRPFTLTEIVSMARDGSLSRYATLRKFDGVEAIVKDVIVPVCEAMQVANVENGVVHRDLKPDNVLVDSRTLRPYVIDFGICHVLERKTRVGGIALAPTAEDAGIVGTPRFLAPEQARGTVDARTDVWGLGALLRFCFTGEPPIAAATPITRAELKRRVTLLTEAESSARRDGDETKADLCAEKLARLEDTGLRTYDDVFQDAREGVYTPLPSEVPNAAAAILRKAMAPRAGDRYVNPRSMASDVTAWLAGTRTRAKAAEGTSAADMVSNVGGALRRNVVSAFFALVALGIGVLVGRSIGIRSAAASASAGVAAAQTALGKIDDRLDGEARRELSRYSVADDVRLHDLLWSEIDAERAVIASSAREDERDEALARADRVADRIAPQRVRIVGPAASPKSITTVSVEDVTRGAGPKEVPAESLALRPGEYRVGVGSLKFPLVVRLVVRARGQAAAREAPRHSLKIVVDPSTVPEDMALVVAGDESVPFREPPWSPPLVVPAKVAPFLIDRHEVSNGEWEEFLTSIPEDGRKARVPAAEFVPDADRPGHFMVPRSGGQGHRTKDLPVRGVSPDDALAYCAWRSKKESATVRLPTEAEWTVSAGVLLGGTLPGGARGLAEDGDFAAFVPVASAKDDSPYGLRGMLGNVREIVTVVGSKAFLSKGGGAGDAPIEAAIRRIRPLAHDVRDLKTGFRCVREVK